MFFEISKFLKFLMSPITWVIVLLILYFLVKKKPWKRVFLATSIAFFIIFTNGLLVEYLKYQTVKPYYNTQIDKGKHYPVAIVMGGFASVNRETRQIQYEENRADRLWEAIRLWHKGQVDCILISGDPSSSIDKKGESTHRLFLDYMQQMGVPNDVFILEQEARNTRENALFSAELLAELNINPDDCLLITSATHMERSLKCFRKIGFHPDYLTVNNYQKPYNISHRAFYPNWKAAVEWEELLNEWIGELAYKIMGYI